MTYQEKLKIMREVLRSITTSSGDSPQEAAYRASFVQEVESLPEGAVMEIPNEIAVEGVDD